MVELVLEPEEGSCLLLALDARRAELREYIDIPTGAERFGAGAFDDDDVGNLGLGPFLRQFRERERERGKTTPGGARRGGGGGVRTWSRGTIFCTMDRLRALNFSGRLSSMVRTPRLESKRTSSDAFGSGITGIVEVDI